ncbi:MAG: cytochrome P450 [Actinobacteria bacterium]|jgi:cytochrome P450|nr:cytochrome P450 [Actinomycetota bacterium]
MSADYGSPTVEHEAAAGDDEAGYRSYEVYQRERVGSPPPVKPGQLRTQDYLDDPYTLLASLRNYGPSFRDWQGNAFWITHYNDVTSVLVDSANFATRSKRWFYGLATFGRDLRNNVPFLTAQAAGIDKHAPVVAREIVEAFAKRGTADLATEFAAVFPLQLLGRTWGIPDADLPVFAERYLRMQRGFRWNTANQEAGKQAMLQLVSYFTPLLAARRADPQDDVLSALATLEIDGPAIDAHDVVATLLEGDHETLHGALANMWFLLLTHPEQLNMVNNTRRLVKYAYLETLRHSTPVLSGERFAKREVERFGLLIPEGALVICSAAGANRDETIFADADQFIVGRKDLVQREPRGQYRADGLPAGITPALGTPSKFPALPVGRPRSLYAITRDVATIASHALLDATSNLKLAPGAQPVLKSRGYGELHTCWHLPVTFAAK